jgi:predicted O-linked N-acetylglucosamine transferase (SPINDLY family)
VHRLRGEVLLKLDRFSEAVDAFTMFLKVGEPVADVYRARSAALAKLGRSGEAMNDLTRSLELEPEAANMLTRRGWAYLLRAESLAEKDFAEAVKQNPENADSCFGLAYARVLQGDIEGAQQAVRDGAKWAEIQFEEQGSTMTTWGLFYNASTVFAQAIPHVQKTAQLSTEEKRSKSIRMWQTRSNSCSEPKMWQVLNSLQSCRGQSIPTRRWIQFGVGRNSNNSSQRRHPNDQALSWLRSTEVPALYGRDPRVSACFRI